MLVILDDSLISSWQPFYASLGTGAAALLGLLFVAMSLRHNIESSRSIDLERSIWSFGSISLASFADLFLVALAFLAPRQTTQMLGLIVLLPGAIGGIFSTVLLLWRGRGLSRRATVFGFITPLCFVAQAVIGVHLMLGSAEDLGWLALIFAISLINALILSWLLLATPLFIRMQQQSKGTHGNDTGTGENT